MAASGDDI